MRICIVNEVLNKVSGTSIQTCMQAKELAKRGHDVHVFALGELHYQLDIGIAKFHSAGKPSYKLIESEEILYGFANYVLKANKKIKFDIIHAHYCTAIMVSVINKVILNTPFVFTIHGYELCACLTSSLHFFSLKAGVALASSIISVSKAALSELCDLVTIENNITHIIPDSIEIDEDESKDYSFELTSFDINTNNKFIFTFIGRLVIEKGVKELLYAFSKHIEFYMDSILFIVGDGPLRDEVKKTINDLHLSSYVFLVGHVPHYDVFLYLKKANISVLPSYNEGLGTVILESLYCGTPVIATNVGGINEVLIHEYNGILVNKNSVEDLLKAMNLIRTDPVLYTKIKGNAYLSTEKFSKESIMQQLVDTYMSCINDVHNELTNLRKKFNEVYTTRNPYL